MSETMNTKNIGEVLNELFLEQWQTKHTWSLS